MLSEGATEASCRSREYVTAMGRLEQLLGQLNSSAKRRGDEFHTPKNHAMALAGEVGELVEIF